MASGVSRSRIFMPKAQAIKEIEIHYRDMILPIQPKEPEAIE